MHSPKQKIQMGISACLLGQQVRFDGGHQQDAYLKDILGNYFDYIPLCPEVAIGLGVPRSSLRLIGLPQPKAIMPSTGQDHTKSLEAFAKASAEKLTGISGYIFKKKSPSCGLERVKIYSPEGLPIGQGMGIYAQSLTECLPLLPVEEEGRLYDLRLRENFIKRVYLYSEWQQICKEGLTIQALLNFHTRHKLLLISHHYGNSQLLGKLIAHLPAHASQEKLLEVADQYIQLFMKTLKTLPDRRHHGQVLVRIVSTINRNLNPKQQEDFWKIIEEYLAGYLPLSVPVRMIRHFLSSFHDPYLELQSYLRPYPDELGLMN